MQINSNNIVNPFADLSAASPVFKVPVKVAAADPSLSKTAAAAANNATDFLAADPENVTDLAAAIMGEVVVRDLLARNAVNELVMIEAIIMDAILSNADTGFVQPNVEFAPNGDIEAASADTVLPEGVNGAFIPGEDGEPGTILLSESLKDTPELLNDVMLEELGEALGSHVESLGFDVAPGDVGNRVKQVIRGETLEISDFAQNASGDDLTQVKFNGDIVEAKAADSEVTPANFGALLPTEGISSAVSPTASGVNALVDIPDDTTDPVENPLAPTSVAIWDELGVTQEEYNTALELAHGIQDINAFDDGRDYLSLNDFDDNQYAGGLSRDNWNIIINVYGSSGPLPLIRPAGLAVAILDGAFTYTHSGDGGIDINFDKIGNESLVAGIFNYIEKRDNGGDRLDQVTIEQIDFATNDILNDFHAIQADRDFDGLRDLLSDGEGGAQTISRSSLLGALEGGVLRRNVSVDKGNHISITVQLDQAPADATYRIGPQITSDGATITTGAKAGDVIGALSVTDDQPIDASQIQNFDDQAATRSGIIVVDGQLVLNKDAADIVSDDGTVSGFFKVRDVDGNVGVEHIVVNVVPEQELSNGSAHPGNIELSTNKVEADAVAGTSVATFNSTDRGSIEGLRTELVGGDTEAFEIVGNELLVKNDLIDGNTYYYLEVNVENADGELSLKNFIIQAGEGFEGRTSDILNINSDEFNAVVVDELFGKLEDFPDGTDEKNLFNLHKAQAMYFNPEMRQFVNIELVNQDIQTLLTQPEIASILKETTDELAMERYGTDTKGVAAQLKADFLSPAKIEGLIDLPADVREQHVNEVLTDIFYFDKGIANEARMELYPAILNVGQTRALSEDTEIGGEGDVGATSEEGRTAAFLTVTNAFISGSRFAGGFGDAIATLTNWKASGIMADMAAGMSNPTIINAMKVGDLGAATRAVNSSSTMTVAEKAEGITFLEGLGESAHVPIGEALKGVGSIAHLVAFFYDVNGGNFGDESDSVRVVNSIMDLVQFTGGIPDILNFGKLLGFTSENLQNGVIGQYLTANLGEEQGIELIDLAQRVTNVVPGEVVDLGEADVVNMAVSSIDETFAQLNGKVASGVALNAQEVSDLKLLEDIELKISDEFVEAYGAGGLGKFELLDKFFSGIPSSAMEIQAQAWPPIKISARRSPQETLDLFYDEVEAVFQETNPASFPTNAELREDMNNYNILNDQDEIKFLAMEQSGSEVGTAENALAIATRDTVADMAGTEAGAAGLSEGTVETIFEKGFFKAAGIAGGMANLWYGGELAVIANEYRKDGDKSGMAAAGAASAGLLGLGATAATEGVATYLMAGAAAEAVLVALGPIGWAMGLLSIAGLGASFFHNRKIIADEIKENQDFLEGEVGTTDEEGATRSYYVPDAPQFSSTIEDSYDHHLHLNYTGEDTTDEGVDETLPNLPD